MAISIRLADASLPWFDRKRLLGIVLAAVAALLVLFLTRPTPMIPVLVASTDIEPGQPLGSQDVSVRYVESASGLVDGSSLGDLAEWSVRVPILAGEPLLPSLLQAPELIAAPNVVALSLDPGHAVLGRLVAGDRVDVYQTVGGTFDSDVTTDLIASGVYIVEARFDGDGMSSEKVDLLLAVDDELAARIVSADRRGEIDLVRIAP